MLRLLELETCESTNDEAWRLLPETALVVTRRQTRGRGRQGRSWQDSPENVMMSLGLVPPSGLATALSWVPLAAGVACIDAIKAIGSPASSDLRLKWPNDIMWADAKMGGILCESRFKGATLGGLVIGIGLNLASAPEVPDAKTTCLAAQLPALLEKERLADARRRFIQTWSDRMLFWIGELAAGRSADLRNAWLGCAQLDRFGRYGDSGHAVDLDERGRLALKSLAGKLVFLDQPL